jgi:hypothetical protein
MEAIRGVFDGEKIIATDKITTRKKYKVIITFVEEIDDAGGRPAGGRPDEESRNFTAQTDGLSFWQDEREDLYQDYLKKD